MAKQDKPKAEAQASRAEKPDSPVPAWLILLAKATGGAVAALAAIYGAYRLWTTPSSAELELAKVTVGYEIRQPDFLRSVMKLDHGCTEAVTTYYRADGELLKFSASDGQIFASNDASRTNLAWIIFLRVDNHSESPLKNVFVKTLAGATYSSSSIPPKGFVAYFVDARSVADENGKYVAAGNAEATVTFSIATAQGNVKSSLPNEMVRQSNVTGCGPGAVLLSPQRLRVASASG